MAGVVVSLRRPLVRTVVTAASAAAFLALHPVAMSAHLNSTGLGPIYDGAAHLLLSPEDLVPACAIALLAGLRGPRHSRVVLAALPVSWLLGGVVGMAIGHASSNSVAVLSLLTVGALVALDINVSLSALAALTVALGFVHGYVNGGGMDASVNSAQALVGLAALLFVVAGLVAAFAIQSRQPWRRIAVRVLGSWVAASGLLMLGWAMHRTGARP
jgi:urease accessory protein